MAKSITLGKIVIWIVPSVVVGLGLRHVALQQAAHVAQRTKEQADHATESRTPTRTIGQYKNYMDTRFIMRRDWKVGTIKLSDVDVRLTTSGTGITLWFGLIAGVESANNRDFHQKPLPSVLIKTKREYKGFSKGIGVDFPDETNRDKFYLDLIAAHKAWTVKYPEFR